MNFTWEELEVTKKKLAVEVPVEDVRDKLDQTYTQARKIAKIKGFRPGKAPMNMIRRMYKESVEQEVTEGFINEALADALKKADLELAAPANVEEVDFAEDKPLKFTFSMEVKPQFSIDGYTGVELTREPVDVTEEMIEDRLEQIREAYATTKSIEESRPLQSGDLAVIDYKSFIDDEPVEGGANPNFQLDVGAGYFNEDFESQLIGLDKDKEKEITVDFPEDHYNPKLAGHKVKFEVKLLDIKEKILPELNDDFVKDLGGEFKTVDDLTGRVKNDLVNMEEQRTYDLLRASLRDKLLDMVDIEAPEGMVNIELQSMLSQLQSNLERSGLTFEAAGMSEEKIREDYREGAEKNVKTTLVLEKIAKKENITVTEDELRQQLTMIAIRTGRTPEQVLEIYSQDYMLRSLRNSMLIEKTLNFLLENANITDTTPASVEENDEGRDESVKAEEKPADKS